ncbi:MAG: hypothetical protein JOZ17_06945 [Acetobacteraceae bacterium]|nr:hypothetical protein [Acetobacteraceae bacterium]
MLAILISASGVLVSSCSTGSAYLREGAAPQTMPSFDGLYQGSVRTSRVAEGAPMDWCETTPRMKVEVKNNGFVYEMPHPNVLGNPTTVYSVYIYPDGSIQTVGGSTGIVSGRVTGTRMAGVLSGYGCEYTFSADRSS